MKKAFLIWLLLLLGLCFALPTAAQDSQEPVSILVEAGFDSYFRLEYWLPVRVQIRNDGAAISGRITVRPDTSGRAVTSAYSSPIELPTGSEKTSFLYIQATSQATSILVELLDNEGVRIAEQRVALVGIAPHDSLHVFVSGTGAGNIPLGNLTTGGSNARTGRWDVSQLPPDAGALLALDSLIFYDVNTDELNVGQREALRQWLSLGGHLVVVGGPSWAQTASGLVDLLPFTPENSENVDALPALAAFAGSPNSLEGRSLITTGTVKDGARVLAATEAGLPLIIRGAVDAGTIDYLSFDPVLDPLRSWDALPDFWFALMSSASPEVGWNRGFLDNQETARALAILPNVELLPPVSSMVIYLLAYILLIGPVNYYVLARFKRLGWAWFTIPLFILGFTALSWTVGFNLRGSEVIVSRLYVVQSYPDSQIARQDSLYGVLSPRREIYTIGLPQGYFANLMPSLEDDTIFQANVTRSTAEIVETERFQIEDVAIDGGIFANFGGFSMIEAPAISGTATLSFGGDNFTVRGIVRNDTDFDLENVVILARNRFYRVTEALAAGDILDFDTSNFTLIYEDTATLLPLPSPLESVFALDLGNDLRNQQATTDSLVSARLVMGLPWRYDARSRNIEFIELEREEDNRRRALLNSFMRDQYAAGAYTNDVYLIGWSNAVRPNDIEVSDSEYVPVDTSLYIVQLASNLEENSGGNVVTLAPDQFSWVIKDRAAGQVTGGLNDMTLINPAWIEMRFMPLENAVLAQVDSMTVELDRSSSYGREVEVTIWNWETQTWDAVGVNASETYVIENPAAYLGANNWVDIRLTLDRDLASSAASARIRGLRVTMTGSF